MNKISVNDSAKHFAALKLIEQLYLEKKIPEHVFKNILYDAKDVVDTTKFTIFKPNKEVQDNDV